MIELSNIYKLYKDGYQEIRALDGISLVINDGEFVSIVGASGSGKSTCMNILGCLDVPSGGTYLLNNIDVSTLDAVQQAHLRNREIGFIFQQYNLIQKLTILENVELPLLYYGLTKKARRTYAMEALEIVGLSDRKNNLPTQLSGGQQQRVAIARAIVAKPSIILADEPTGALDSKTGVEILNILKNLHKEGSTVIIITHDISIANQTNRIIQLSDGKIIADKYGVD